MEDFEIMFLILFFVAFGLAVVALWQYDDLEIQHRCTRIALHHAEEDIKNLRADLELLKKKNDQGQQEENDE